MFCTNCGAEIMESANFCSKCGSNQCKSNDYRSMSHLNEYTNNINGSMTINTTTGMSILKANYMEIFKTFFIGMIFVTLGAYFGINYLPYSIVNIINVLFVVFMIASVFLLKGDIVKDKVSMNIYCFILGIILSVTLAYYIGYLGYSAFFTCVLGVSLIFAIAYWHASKSSAEDILSAGPMLFKCMIGLLVFEILNIFIFGFGLFDMILSGAGIAIYSGYTLYVMKGMQLKCSNELLNEYDIVKISLSLITSFLNLLLQLLRLLAAIKSKD